MKKIQLSETELRQIVYSVINESEYDDMAGVDYNDDVMEEDPTEEIIDEYIPVSERKFKMNNFDDEMSYWKRVVMDAVQSFMTDEAKKERKSLVELDIDGTMFNTLVNNVMLELKEL